MIDYKKRSIKLILFANKSHFPSDSSLGIPYTVLWLNVWNKELLTLRNSFVVIKKFLKAKFDCNTHRAWINGLWYCILLLSPFNRFFSRMCISANMDENIFNNTDCWWSASPITYTLAGKVILMLCNKLLTDSCNVTVAVASQESAHNLLHSTKRTLLAGSTIS